MNLTYPEKSLGVENRNTVPNINSYIGSLVSGEKFSDNVLIIKHQ